LEEKIPAQGFHTRSAHMERILIAAFYVRINSNACYLVQVWIVQESVTERTRQAGQLPTAFAAILRNV
ncbi:MAG: hypothetical protein IJ088_10670, partial [Clostridia bacterium]|nr:hypothetical protein [Clostridia bacterium]